MHEIVSCARNRGTETNLEDHVHDSLRREHIASHLGGKVTLDNCVPHPILHDANRNINQNQVKLQQIEDNTHDGCRV